MDKIFGGTVATTQVVDNKLSATSTNPVQNKVVTAALNEKANKETVEGLKLNPAFELGEYNGYLADWESLTDMVDDIPAGVSILYADAYGTTYEYGLVIKSYGDSQQLVVILNNGQIYETHEDYDTWEWTEWTSPYTTPSDLDNAIGDIETSLDNILKKYGLGGDGV